MKNKYYLAFINACYEFERFLWRYDSRDGFVEVQCIPDDSLDSEHCVSGQHSGIYHRQSNVVFHAFFHHYYKREFKTEHDAIVYMKQARKFCED